MLAPNILVLAMHSATSRIVFIPFNGGSFCISLFWLMLNREEPRFLLSLRMWGEVNCRRFTTVGKVGTGATVLVYQRGIAKFKDKATYRQTYKARIRVYIPGELACEPHVEEDRRGLCEVHWIHREGMWP